ncbi:coiled-coil domain-containing protein 1 [Ceratitis capitata]|uniref:coiled-coil domain-containing protein 1 n=1 Tax=Ceratitis capitata TaxID=7213 RepID=UPI000329F35E|nr:coiled-coil domain-containing protein 1 [Ceratitis capitata]
MAESNQNEHESNESDEDCEVYFLKPVNEYNIVEKIKEANKVLFEETTTIDEQPACSGPFDAVGDLGTRKVTFAPNLETYEPDNSLLETLKLTREFEDAVAEAKELDRKLTDICKYQTILEETTPNTNEVTDTELATVDTNDKSEISDAGTRDSADTDTEEEVTQVSTVEVKEAAVSDADDEVVEEICEEISVMDMENEELQPQVNNAQIGNQRRMVKLRTFDCAEEDPPEANDSEQDNKSMVNLLTSDGEEECCSAATFDINDCNSDLDVDDIEADCSRVSEANGETNPDVNDDNNSINDTTTDVYDDDDEDDDLSIIVASYLTDDIGHKRLYSNRNKPTNKARRLLPPLSKRFSLRGKTLARNAIGTCADGTEKVARRPPHLPPPEVTDLKLNYRTCCEYRRQLTQNEKLPKYTGYLSEYGLSRQQLELREESLQRKQRFALQQTLKANETEMRKMHDNERAFTTWLRNKMRYPINKTRNMFDVKRRSLDAGFGGSMGTCGGKSAVRNASAKRT